MKKITKKDKRENRHNKVRMKVAGSADKPRLCIFKSNGHIYAQLIDDQAGKTLASSSDLVIKADQPAQAGKKGASAFTKVSDAQAVGFDVGKKAVDAGISKVVFDRGGYIYTGRVKAVADGAREAGLQF